VERVKVVISLFLLISAMAAFAILRGEDPTFRYYLVDTKDLDTGKRICGLVFNFDGVPEGEVAIETHISDGQRTDVRSLTVEVNHTRSIFPLEEPVMKQLGEHASKITLIGIEVPRPFYRWQVHDPVTGVRY
jgi:hypothetical protein